MKGGIIFRKKAGQPIDIELLIQMIENEPATSFDEKLVRLIEEIKMRQGQCLENPPSD